MSERRSYIAFDCGNSSIRTVLGHFDGERITTELVHQVKNKAITTIHYDFWDILHIFDEMHTGFKKALDRCDTISSFGISTWGIDFGLLGASGELLANPLCYRNPLGQIGMDRFSEEQKRGHFYSTGIQNHPMNSMYQLMGIEKMLPEYLSSAERVLLIPDLLNYLFTGEMNSEISIASTMQLIDMRTRDYAGDLIGDLGLRRDLFSEMTEHGSVRGMLRSQIAQKLHCEPIPAVCVPSHDTAAAVAVMPKGDEDAVFISSGTWSLIGTELSEPIIDERVYAHGFANEGGVYGSITLLKNSTGMHILEQIKREMEFDDSRVYSWDELIEMSRSSLKDAQLPVFDPNASCIYHPESMTAAVRSLIGDVPIGEVIASCYRSLAESYADTIRDLEQITGKTYPVIHVISGGARNDHLNQMTADLSGKLVTAGPVEATSLGTIALQILHDHPQMDMNDIRKLIIRSEQISSFEPGR